MDGLHKSGGFWQLAKQVVSKRYKTAKSFPIEQVYVMKSITRKMPFAWCFFMGIASCLLLATFPTGHLWEAHYAIVIQRCDVCLVCSL